MRNAGIVDLFVRIPASFGDRRIMKMPAERPIVERPGVGVRAVDQNVRSGDPRLLGRLFAGPAGNIGRDADQVAENKRRLLVPLTKDDSLGLERIMGPRIEPLVEIAAHPIAEGRSDVDNRHAGLKVGCGCQGRNDGDRHQGGYQIA